MRTKLMVAILMCFSVGMLSNANAQVKKRAFSQKVRCEKTDSMKSSRVASALMLDDKTTALFEPVYMEYLQSMNGLRKPMQMMKKPDSMNQRKCMMANKTDAEVQKMIEDHFVQAQKMLDLNKEYYNKFKEFLSPKQIAKMYNMERMGCKMMPMNKKDMKMNKGCKGQTDCKMMNKKKNKNIPMAL
ncbi:MAG: hypothetical protein M0P00_05575 [Bacteroidaceae bacterium]|nr:hypothetical protein [Bacteroidaceae bacterium]